MSVPNDRLLYEQALDKVFTATVQLHRRGEALNDLGMQDDCVSLLQWLSACSTRSVMHEFTRMHRPAPRLGPHVLPF
jgi:hypothetical protein